MNKFISSIRLFAIICSLYAGFASASLTEEKIQKLDEIEAKIQAYVVNSTRLANDFLDMNNKESFSKYVSRFKALVVSCEHDVLAPLRAEKKAGDSSEYGQAIVLTHDIVSTLYNQAKHVLTIFEKHRGNPNVFSLGLDLQAAEQYAKPEVLSGLQAKLKKLQSILNNIYQSLAKKIGIIIDSLEQRKANNKLTMKDKFDALKHRLNCKN